jgi:AcrR family transcriptional regulator
MNVPVSEIASQAGVGVGTFYRSFPDREALLRELEFRAYAALNAIIDAIEGDGVRGLPAVHRYLLDALEIGEQLILPLHGAPPLIDETAVNARARIDTRLGRFIQEGQSDLAIGPDVNSTDVIMFSALVTNSLSHSPNWDRSARRLVAIFVSGLSSSRTIEDPPVVAKDLEREFISRSRRGSAEQKT